MSQPSQQAVPDAKDQITDLCTLQFASGGLLDAVPVDDYAVHLIRQKRSGGTPGPTLCGIDRFAPGSAGWSVGGGVSSPGVEHKPCPGCAETARTEFPGLPIGGLGAQEMAAVLGVPWRPHPYAGRLHVPPTRRRSRESYAAAGRIGGLTRAALAPTRQSITQAARTRAAAGRRTAAQTGDGLAESRTA